MKKGILFTIALSAITIANTNAQDLKKLGGKLGEKVGLNTETTGLSEGEVASGLKEALTSGVGKGVSQLSIY